MTGLHKLSLPTGRIDIGDAGVPGHWAITGDIGPFGFLLGDMGDGRKGLRLAHYSEQAHRGIEITLKGVQFTEEQP